MYVYLSLIREKAIHEAVRVGQILKRYEYISSMPNLWQHKEKCTN